MFEFLPKKMLLKLCSRLFLLTTEIILFYLEIILFECLFIISFLSLPLKSKQSVISFHICERFYYYGMSFFMLSNCIREEREFLTDFV